MTVSDFCSLCTEAHMTDVTLFDSNEKFDGPDHIVFQGTMHDASFSEFSDYEVGSFDLTEEGLTLNIDTSEE